jgi:hypothetical protein
MGTRAMAFSIKLTAMKWGEGGYACVEVPGEISDRHVSSDDPRFRQIAQTTGYLDYFAVLSPEEAREIAAMHYKELASLWKSSGHSTNAEEALNEAKDALEGADIVVAHLYEWESGLG